MLNNIKKPFHSFINRYKSLFCIFFWTLLNGYPVCAQPIELTIPVGHPNTTMDFSADGKLLVTGSFDNSFIIWDVRTSHMIRHVFVGNQVQQILLLPNNEELITVSGNESVKYVLQKWEIKTGQLKAEMPFTASPGIQILPGTTYLFVPDFSTQKVDNTGGMLNQSIRMSKSEAYEDSIEQVFDNIMEELVRQGEIEPATDDPKKLKAYQEKALEVKMELLTGIQRNISIIDATTFEPVAIHRYTAQKVKTMTCKGTNYLVTVNDMPNTFDKDVVIGLWEINELIAQSRQKIKIKPQKEWHVKTSIENLIVAPGTGYFATCNDNNAIQLWQIQNGAPISTLTAKGQTVNGMSFSSRGDELYVYSGNSQKAIVENWNTVSLNRTFTMDLPSWYMPGDICISPYDKYFLLPCNNGLVKFSLKGDSISRFSGKAGIATRFGFAKNDQEVFIKYNELPNLKSPEMMGYFKKQIAADLQSQGKTPAKEEIDQLLNLKMSTYNSFYSSPLFKSFILKWDLSGKGITTENNFSDSVNRVSRNQLYMLANEKYKKPGLQTASLNSIMKDTPAGDGDEKQDADEKNMMKFIRDPKNGFTDLLYTDSLNGPVLWLINTKTRDTVSFISIDTTDWVILLKSGYYWSSKNGAKQLGYTKGLNVYPFEQFDVRYNRPDLVLQAIGKTPPDQISDFRQLYLKRIKSMGLDTNRFTRDFNVPEADFSNRNEIDYEQKTNQLRLQITARDKQEPLVCFNIWVNGVPLFGTYGKSIIEAQSKQLNTTIEVTLSRGKNRIETSVTNANGAESYHLPLIVSCLAE